MNSILNLVKVISYKNYVKFLKIENYHGGESDHMIYTALFGGIVNSPINLLTVH